MNNHAELRAQTTPWWNGVKFLFTVGDAVGTTVQMERQDDPSIKPTFELDRDAAQVLMDDLWNCGLRPTEGAGSAGSLRATEKHLKDMRQIAFYRLGIKGE